MVYRPELTTGSSLITGAPCRRMLHVYAVFTVTP
jgi:hypothetical protein